MGTVRFTRNFEDPLALDLARAIFADFSERVTADGGTIEGSEECVASELELIVSGEYLINMVDIRPEYTGTLGSTKADLVFYLNDGTGAPIERFRINTEGDIEVKDPSKGIILRSENNTAYRIVVGNTGTLAAIPPDSFKPVITTLPTISGTLNVGETLTETAGNVSGEPTPTQVLQWQRSDNGLTGWADIAGATGTTYLLGLLDEDKYIRVQQTEENILGTATANSASTTQIGPLQYIGLLDEYPNSAVAYSLRRLRAGYSGSAIKVRRASDNALQDISFINNELDTATLESFCSGTDGFVHTWYDQSGNGYDVTQAVASRQPKIVNTGSTITDGTKPSVQFDGGQGLNTTANVSGASDYYPFYVRSIDSASGNYIWDSQVGRVLIERTFIAAYYDQTNGFEGSPLTNSYRLIHMELNSTTGGKVYENGVYTQAGLSYTQYPMSGQTALGSRYDVGASWLYGKIQEFILYNTDQSTNRTGIETNINAFYNIY
jgi:hypothetical protein